VSISVDPSSLRQWQRASGALRGADGRISRGLRDAQERAVAPVRGELAASARAVLPRRGGLAARAAQLTTRVTTSGGSEVVTTVTVQGIPQLAGLDEGVVEHPVYGRGPRVRQRVRAGFAQRVFAGPVVGRVERETEQAVGRVVDDIVRAAR
jgi:hypothetical protein